MNCYKASPLSRNIIRSYVRQVKEQVGLVNEYCFPILTFVENILPTVIPDFQFEIVPVSEMRGKHGETFPSKHIMRIREDVYLGATQNKGRDRFTIAHEVAHLILHEDSSISLCRLAPKEKLRPFEDPEWQADAFAGELLASSYLIKGMTVAQVQKKCFVSSAAARTQLSSLDR
jgi:Zn-dependent peptidase ImmA (M78 family)